MQSQNTKSQRDVQVLSSQWRTPTVLRVGDGRGFVVMSRHYLGGEEPIIITAAHCLPHLPPPHPGRYIEEETYERLLAPLGSEAAVWATCLFVDPVADIAALGPPDSQELYEQWDAYHRLLDETEPWTVADAPAQGFELANSIRPDLQIKYPTPGEGPARVLSVTGDWLEGCVERRGCRLAFKPESHFVGGMSGSPIVSNGQAIGVVSVDLLSPVLMDTLAPWLVRSILSAQAEQETP